MQLVVAASIHPSSASASVRHPLWPVSYLHSNPYILTPRPWLWPPAPPFPEPVGQHAVNMTDNQTWWTEDRVQATVTPEYILKQFRLEDQKLLKRTITFGNGVTDHTYLGWILERATRFFLILTHIGVPGLIFGLIDESYEDSDLPIAAEAVQNLRFPSGAQNSLEGRFYKSQFKYLVREVKEGHHIRFLNEETVPVRLVGSASGINRAGKDGIEKVHLSPGIAKVYGRKRIGLEEPPTYLTEADILSEIAFAKTLAHQHVLSVYASYSHDHNVFVLLTPAIEYTLSSFVDSVPRHFENLPKSQRRETILNWPHCLANGLAWLHSQRAHHGAIRPSNVIIDSEYRIYLGQIDGLPITHGNVKVSDIESYQYAAPERWKRTATMQTKAPAMLTLHSGSRTARKQSTSKYSAGSSVNDVSERRPSLASPTSPNLSMDTSKPTSTAYPFIPTSKANVSRGQSINHDKPEYAGSILSSISSGTRRDRSNSLRVPTNHPDHPSRLKPATATRSTVSSHSGEGGQNVNSGKMHAITVAPSEIRSALVQTWQSAQFDPFAADVFSLGAIIVEIMTLFCKRGSGAFSRHRSAKNRTAGRGGGVADASFHANLGQVYAWTVMLEQDAAKKASKEEGKVFAAVSPVVDIARECLARSAEDRPNAGMVEKSLEGCIEANLSSGIAHCNLESSVGSAGKLRSAPRPTPKHTSIHTSMFEKEIHIAGKPHPNHASLASFNFGDYDLKKESMYKGDEESDRRSFDRRRYSVIYADDATIDLQSIADRPDPTLDGIDLSGWRDLHTESRASYVTSDTQPGSIADPQPIDKFFKPASRPPSLPVNDLRLVPSDKGQSPPSLSQSHFSNTARKRITPDTARQRQPGSAVDSARQREMSGASETAGSTRSGSSTDQARKRFSVMGPDVHARGSVTSESSTDSSLLRNSLMSSTGHSRGRLSVSTLASNTSTIRLEWQQREVSPISIRDHNRTPNASVSALGGAPSEDEEEMVGNEEQRTPSSRLGELSSAERMYRNLQRNRTPFTNTGTNVGSNIGSINKGKKKSESTGTKRAWLQSRYSLLGGRM
jgi:serine/threonine protein kinase